MSMQDWVDKDFYKVLGVPKTASQDEMMDSQLQVYAWGANDVVKSWGYGGIRATAYDRVKSVAPKPPKRPVHI